MHHRLPDAIASEEPLAVTEPIIAEVAAGARDDQREQQLRRLLARCELLRFEAVTDFDGAVRVYRECGRDGVTRGACSIV